MNNKGFILIESLVSLSIVLLITILMNGVIINNYKISAKQEKNIEILQIAKSSLEKAKDEVKNSDFYQNESSEVIENYTINKEIEDNRYYKKINISVEDKTDSLEVISYVYKQ